MRARSNSQPRERTPRSFWFDPRFAIGILLVLGSVAGVFAVVSTADSSVQVYAARSALAPGDRVVVGDLGVKSVRLGDLRAKYLGAGEIPGSGFVVTRSVAAGELVPVSSVGKASGLRVASVVVTVRGELARSIAAVSVVDLWSAPATDSNSFGPPSVLVASATVVRVIEPSGLVADRGGRSVELLVPKSKTARVLEAIANQDAISLVPVGIPARG
ncbi:hypothetical protein [Lacisediminihabitans profunda]|uniref:SAF domain-containing protein n=1 Tax=Lacisediminihabitans profunda TaxID=2594790 RepID=A0A5C8UMQ9_9MICO|nr:hypothetical protein [Lacisediminihabitans profunda]TXN28770.1 hypothetical protein FVP33_16390 [Lacisediminihabitans profunda]